MSTPPWLDVHSDELKRDKYGTIEAMRQQHWSGRNERGDTRPHPAVIEHGKGCDILVHEVHSERGIQQVQPKFPLNYFRRMHTSTVALAEIANEIRPKKLVLTHEMHLGPVSDEELLQEITDLYDGEVIFGRDLDVFQR
ncbi:MAG: hypothetical protein AAF639_13335 [Chloroflexota bacterium]